MANGYQASGYYNSAVPQVKAPTGRTPTSRRPETSEDRATDVAYVAQRKANPQPPLGVINPPGPGPGPGPSGPGRTYGGGGGGGGGSAAAEKAALQAAYWDYITQSDAQYNSFDDTLSKLYDPAIVNSRYDAAQGGVKDATRTGRDRINKIYNDQMARNATASQAVAGAFQQGGQALTGLQNRFMAANNQINGGLNKSLGAFGAGQLGDDPGAQLNSLFGAGQMYNQQQANTWAAAQADRGAIYGAQAQDVLSGMSQEEAALMRQIAAQRATDLRQNDVTLATGRNENARGKLDTNLAIQQAMAEMGITQAGRVDPGTGLPTNLTEAQKAYLRSVDPARQGGA